MANDTENLFMFLFTIQLPSSVQCLFMFFAHFLIAQFVFLLSSLKVHYLF